MNNTPVSNTPDPLHGKTLESIVTELSTVLGWEKMYAKIPINCFVSDPSVSSSLKFLRKTPWARQKVEVMYIFNIKKIKNHFEQKSN